jgi:hypothetical protein
MAKTKLVCASRKIKMQESKVSHKQSLLQAPAYTATPAAATSPNKPVDVSALALQRPSSSDFSRSGEILAAAASAAAALLPLTCHGADSLPTAGAQSTFLVGPSPISTGAFGGFKEATSEAQPSSAQGVQGARSVGLMKWPSGLDPTAVKKSRGESAEVSASISGARGTTPFGLVPGRIPIQGHEQQQQQELSASGILQIMHAVLESQQRAGVYRLQRACNRLVTE